MNDVTFGSTYRIPLVQPGIGSAKKEALKKAVSIYQNVLYPSGNQGCVRVSVRKRLDEGLEQKIRMLGFKIYQKFEKHNVAKTNFEESGVSKLDLYINKALKRAEYIQYGKQKKYSASFHKPEINEKSEVEMKYGV